MLDIIDNLQWFPMQIKIKDMDAYWIKLAQIQSLYISI